MGLRDGQVSSRSVRETREWESVMKGARCEGSSAQYNEYKKICPPAWIVPTQTRQDGSGDIAMNNAGVSASPLEPSSSDTLIAPSLVSSSSTVQETANGVPQVSTPINEKGKDRTKSTSHIARFSSPSSKSRQYSKLKAVFHSRSKSKSGQSTVDTSSMLATQDTDVDRNDDTRKASDSSTKKFRWPIAIIPAVDAGTGPTEHPESPTAGLKFQPKQSPPQLPKTYSAASATASSQPQPPPPKAPSTASATAPSARGPPPAPSASANNPRDMYDAKEQSDSAVFRSPNPMSAVSGYSTSTTSDLADVPSRLLYYSPGYSPGYSYC